MEEYYVGIYTSKYHIDEKILFSNGKISKDITKGSDSGKKIIGIMFFCNKKQ